MVSVATWTIRVGSPAGCADFITTHPGSATALAGTTSHYAPRTTNYALTSLFGSWRFVICRFCSFAAGSRLHACISSCLPEARAVFQGGKGAGKLNVKVTDGGAGVQTADAPVQLLVLGTEYFREVGLAEE